MHIVQRRDRAGLVENHTRSRTIISTIATTRDMRGRETDGASLPESTARASWVVLDQGPHVLNTPITHFFPQAMVVRLSLLDLHLLPRLSLVSFRTDALASFYAHVQLQTMLLKTHLHEKFD